MSLFNVFNVAGSALNAETIRLNTAMKARFIGPATRCSKP